jgi:hypothetical protein
MGVCTVTKVRRQVNVLGTQCDSAMVDIALSTSYATGGDTVPLASFNFPGSGLTALVLQTGVSSPAGHALEVINGANDYTAPKIRVRDVATGTEISAATNLSAQTIRAIAFFIPFN